MKHYQFSNHTAEQVSRAVNERDAAYQAGMATYQGALDARAAESAAKRREAAEALREGDLIWAVRRFFSSLFCFERALPPVPVRPSATDSERKWRAGNEGETLLANALAQHLDDRWTLVSGYENDRGELDQLLVGPSGVLTLEVKHMAGDLELVGEHAQRKVVRNGELRHEVIADRSGRSPVRQLNEVTDCMVEALRPHWPHLMPRRVVVFTHPKGRVRCAEQLPPDTYVMALARWSLAALAAEQPVFDAPPADAFVRALYAHHQACGQRKARRQERKARRAASVPDPRPAR